MNDCKVNDTSRIKTKKPEFKFTNPRKRLLETIFCFEEIVGRFSSDKKYCLSASESMKKNAYEVPSMVLKDKFEEISKSFSEDYVRISNYLEGAEFILNSLKTLLFDLDNKK